MGQKVSSKTAWKKKKKSRPPQAIRKFRNEEYPEIIVFRNLGIKDEERRILTAPKAIPIPATNAETKKQRHRIFRLLDWIRAKISKLNSHRFFRVKANTFDTLDDDNDEYEIEITENNWNRNIHKHLAIYALVISASNVFRFAHDCVQYGGAVFFLAYFFVNIFIIQPMIYLEMVVGQFSQQGVFGFGALHVFARGIPWAIVFMSLVFVPFNTVVLGYTSKYAYGSFYRKPGNCTDSWNDLSSCVSYDDIRRFRVLPNVSSKPIWYETKTQRTSLLSTELYFRQFILHHNWDGTLAHGHGGWNPTLFFGLGFTYFVVFISTRVRLTSIPSKVIITVAGLLPILLLGLLMSQILRDGALSGIFQLFFLQIQEWTHIMNVKFWSQVFRSAFLTSGIGCGLYSRIASKNPFNNDSLHRTSWFVISILIFICLTTTFILMAELGAIKAIFTSSTYNKIFAEGTGSSFAAIAGALMIFKSRTAIFIFFASCNICGIWSQIVATENCTSQVVHWLSVATKNQKMARYVALAAVIACQAACATLVSMVRGGLMLDSFLFDGTWAAAFVSLAEVISISYMYGSVFFMIDIELMLRHSAPSLFKYQLRYFTPLMLLIILVTLSYTNIRYGDEKYLGVIPIPAFLINCGFAFNAIPPLLILVVGFLGVLKKQEIKGFFWFPAIDYLQRIFTRFTHRRGAIFEAYETQTIDLTAEMKRKAKQQERAEILEKLRLDLEKILKFQRAKANWIRLINRVLVLGRRQTTMKKATKWILREMELKRSGKEVKYIRKILNSYSMECVFTVSKMAAVRRRQDKSDRDHLADILLNTVPPETLEYRYAKPTLYERLMGKGSPVPEVDKAFMVMRIKRHLGLDFSKDAETWLRLTRELDEKRHRHSVFQEEPPVEFFFDHGASTIRVIMFKGKDHSILRNLSHPHPPLVQVPQRQIRQRAGRALWTYLKNIVVLEMRKIDAKKSRSNRSVRIAKTPTKPKFASSKVAPAPNSAKSSKSKVAFAASSAKSSKSIVAPAPASTKPSKSKIAPPARTLFSTFQQWYFNCDPRRYKISRKNTFLMAILDKTAFKEDVKNRFALILPPEGAYRPPEEVVAYNAPGVYEVTYARLKPYYDAMALEQEYRERFDQGQELTQSRSMTSTANVAETNRVRDLRIPRIRQVPGKGRSDDDAPKARRKETGDSGRTTEVRFSDSAVSDRKKREVTIELPGGVQTLYTDSFVSTSAIGRRALHPGDDDWLEHHMIKTRWKSKDSVASIAELARTRSQVYSEKAMAAYLQGEKIKKKGLNEDDEFFYIREGRGLVVEPRNGRQETSDTAIPFGSKLFQLFPKKSNNFKK